MFLQAPIMWCLHFYFIICSCIIFISTTSNYNAMNKWLRANENNYPITRLQFWYFNFSLLNVLICSLIFLIITLSFYWVSFIPHIIHFLLFSLLQFLLIQLQRHYAVHLHFVSSGFCSQPCCHLVVGFICISF